MKKICFLIAYFGDWPEWFDFYLKSCESNSSIDWLFFTDCNEPENLPKNVRLIRGDLKNWEKLVSEKIGLKIEFKNTRKMGDIRPAYGLIFEDYIQEYDFWAYGDIDVIYGNIRKFITDEMLGKYDIINPYDRYLVGHFLMFKNSRKINTLFRKNKDYKKVFLSDEVFVFAETSSCWQEFDDMVHYSKIKSEVESMTHLVMRLKEEKYIKPLFQTMILWDDVKFNNIPMFEGGDWTLLWDNGSLSNLGDGCEYLYFHFLKLKFHSNFKAGDIPEDSSSFVITSRGFYKDIEDVPRNLEVIKKYKVGNKLLVRICKRILGFKKWINSVVKRLKKKNQKFIDGFKGLGKS